MNIRALIYRLSGFKTDDELPDEVKKGKANYVRALEKVRKFSKALTPKELLYPIGGEVFECFKDIQISYFTYFMAPFTSGDKAILLKGERIILSKPKKPKPSGYFCNPLNDAEVKKRIIPASELDDPKYNGFSLFINTTSIKKNFKKIELMPINYKKGDATNPIDSRTKIIVHICNDLGGWGKGFVMAISKKWKQPEAEYRNWFKNKVLEQTDTIQFVRLENRDKYSNEMKFELGNVQFVKVADDIWVANMIAQKNIRPDKDGLPPIRYSFVTVCLQRVGLFAKQQNASVHMPRIGCGLAGGEWSKIEEIINDNLIAHEIETTVYDFE